jgi:hypothetical protein
MVYLGIVTRVHATQGEILIKVQNGFELDELHDVLIASKTNGDLLKYDSATGLWKNSAQSTLTIAQSQVTNLTTDLAGKASTSHTHTFANITDVNITSPTNGQSLTYDSASSKWINSAAAATGETISSFLLMGA